MYRIFVYMLIFIFGILMFAGCDSQEYIARVGQQKVTRSEFVKALQTRYGVRENFRDVTYDQKKEILDAIIERHLKIADARAKGMDQDSSFIAEVSLYRDRLMSSRYHEFHVVDHIVPETALENYIANRQKQVQFTHILLTHSGANPRIARTRGEARQLAQEIMQKIEQGQPIDSLARLYSDDPLMRTEDGPKQWRDWQIMTPQFNSAVRDMEVGEIIGPIETAQIIHIVKLNGMRDNPEFKVPESVEDFYFLKRKLINVYPDSSKKLWDAQRKSLIEKYELNVQKQAVLNLAVSITEKVNAGQLSLADFSDEQRNQPLAIWQGGECSLNTIVKRNRVGVSRLLLKYRHVDALENDVINTSVVEIVVQEALREGINDDPFVRQEVNEFIESKLLQEIEETAVQEDVELSESDVDSFYRENPDKFMKPAEIELWEIYLTNKQKAQRILQQLNNGASFKAMAKKHSEDKVIGDRRGYVGFRAEIARGEVSRAAFKMGPDGKIGGPVPYRRGWVIFKTGKLRPETVRQFKDVKNRATSLLRRERINQNRAKWLAELKESYEITFDEAKIKAI